MSRLPSFAALRALEAAARHRSYTGAAEELAVTHSAISQQMRGLEAELGAKLFERRGNRMEPTPATLQLAGEVARAIEILRVDLEAVAAPAPLVLSVGGYMARRWLPPRLPRLMTDPAGVSLEIQVVDRHVDFASEAVDAAVRNGSGDWPGLSSQLLYSEVMYPVCAPEFARSHPLVHPQDIARTPLLHLRSRPWSIWFDQWGSGQGPAPDGLPFDDALMMIEAAAEGLGLAFIVAGMVDEHIRSGRLVRPFGEDGVAKVDVFLIWPRASRKLDRIHALRDWFLAEVAADAAEAAPAGR